MTRNTKLFAALFMAGAVLLAATATLSFFGKTTPEGGAADVKYTELLKPYRYYTGEVPNCVWDMEIYDGKLFCGGGDYDINAGPVHIRAYNLNEKIWETGGVLYEEEINRFYIIDGKLTTVGVDPQAGWELGNFYTLEGDEWEQHRTIPGGIHCFDIVKFDGTLFVGLGVLEGSYPISASEDGGKTFTTVNMVKNGMPLDTSDENKTYRVYDFFTLNGKLYALYISGGIKELYRYENGEFVYFKSEMYLLPEVNFNYIRIGSKTEFMGKCFFANGYLYESSDMVNFSMVNEVYTRTDSYVYDIYVEDGKMYALSFSLGEQGEKLTSVWVNATGEAEDFKMLFEFEYEAPPLSFVSNGGDFYIAMGDGKTENPKNGEVLFIAEKYYSADSLATLHIIFGGITAVYFIFLAVLFAFKIKKIII